MITAVTWLAAVLFLVPYFCLLSYRLRRDTALWEVALTSPLALAIDFVTLASASRLMTLDRAIVCSRPIWIAVTVALMWREKRRPVLPKALGWREVAAAAAGGAMALALSLSISRPYAVWDRFWHIPLARSITAQHLPFRNLFYAVRLHYHFTGDLSAALLQVLSGERIHSSLALSAVHDIVFALIGISFGLLFRYARLGAGEIMLATMAVLLAGPVTLLREGATIHDLGHSVLNFLTMSFRPHVVLAGLFLLGFVGSIVVRLYESVPPKKTLPILFATTAVLSVTDEVSVGITGIALGAAWLLYPNVIHPSRLKGALVLVGLAAVVLGGNLFLDGTFTKSDGAHTVALVTARLPGYGEHAVPLFTAEGKKLFFQDFLMPVGIWLSGIITLLAVRRYKVLVLFVLYTMILAVGFFALAALEINKDPLQGHRATTAAFYFGALFSVVCWSLLHTAGTSRALRGLGVFAILLSLGLSTASGLQWIVNVAPRVCDTHPIFYGAGDLFKVDCRRQLGAQMFAPVRPTYAESIVWYTYAGCRPIYAAGAVDSLWGQGLRDPLFNVTGYLDIENKIAKPGETIYVACKRDHVRGADPICDAALAEANANCHPVGTEITECEIPPQNRQAFAQKFAK